MSKTKNVEIVTENVVSENVTVLTQFELIVQDTNRSKSSRVRELHSLGLNRSQILAEMKKLYPNMIYQHVRNILVTELKKPTN